jgi:hypothetical protein
VRAAIEADVLRKVVDQLAAEVPAGLPVGERGSREQQQCRRAKVMNSHDTLSFSCKDARDRGGEWAELVAGLAPLARDASSALRKAVAQVAMIRLASAVFVTEFVHCHMSGPLSR